MAIYLNSFYPLCCTKEGQDAARKYKFPAYIDGSCRREPDLINDHPAITGLCRPSFAKKLKQNDIVIYITNKAGVGSNKIVAALQVEEKKESHAEAAAWYKYNNFIIPNNLMVENTKPYPLEQTHERGKWGDDNDAWGLKGVDIKGWNEQYEERAKAEPKVAICTILFRELNNPVVFENDEMVRIFNRIPGTQNPSIVSEGEWAEIKKLIGILKNESLIIV